MLNPFNNGHKARMKYNKLGMLEICEDMWRESENFLLLANITFLEGNSKPSKVPLND